MEILLRTITILTALLTILHCLALGLTVFRLHYRCRTGRLWWDDYLALGAAVLDFIGFVILWMGYAPPGSHLEATRSRMIQYGLGLITVVGTDWLTRISLALAFARIFPPGAPTRTYAIGLANFFAVLFVSVVIPGTISCSKRSSWLFHAGIVVQCDFSKRFMIYFITANAVGDILLVCSPIYKLRRVKLPQIQRRLIFTCIAGSTLMSLSCFATSAFQIGPVSWEPGRGFIIILLGYLESGISLTICNLLVVVTYLYTVTHKQPTIPQVSVEEPKTSSIIPTMTRPTSQPAVVSHDPSMGSVITPLILTEISGAYLTQTDTASEDS